MGLFNVVRRRRTRGVRPPNPKDNAYLRSWAEGRRGVEAFVEPKTMVTETTVVLVAHDGEWTRRRITEHDVRDLGKRLGIPVYDVALVGYPARMRAYTAELARQQKRDRGGRID
jgi:hypothetical protein